MSKYQQTRTQRNEATTWAGKFRGGKLNPVHTVAFRPSEGGALTQTLMMELDPIAGRMITPPTAEIIAVYVPVQALHALKNPDHDYAGNAEVVRSALLTGMPLFGVEEETELSKRMGINPRSVDGTKYVGEIGPLAHNCAVNYLRRRLYDKAAQIDAADRVVTPAMINQTVLDRFNAVLDPEDRVNGQVQLDLEGRLDVQMDDHVGYSSAHVIGTNNATNRKVGIQDEGHFYSDLSTGDGGTLSLTDLYVAERTDKLVREMRSMVDRNPEYGEEMLARWAHGFSVDPGTQPWVLYQKRQSFAPNLEYAMDGTAMLEGVEVTNNQAMMRFSVPVPKTEFGGVVVTFAVLKPDETLASQPHPFLSTEWVADNFVADEMAIDPQPVNFREIFSDVEQSDEGTVAFYTGKNHMLRNYGAYGFNRHVDLSTVASKTALWQLEVPLSVTPESVVYPEELEQYPWQFQDTEVCTYTIKSVARINSPMILGPTPVEEMEVIESANLFEDE